jgi:dTDP-4-amino-4,6-dideoxygalactose transaminase
LCDTPLILPNVPEWAEPAWHLYVVRTNQRKVLQTKLSNMGIGTLIHYPIPPHRQTAYAQMALRADALPIANQLAEEVLSLPIGPQMSCVDEVISSITSILSE